jgi:CheY-like chemotaxis protein
MKNMRPGTAVIVASAYVQNMTKDQVFREGADGFVNKPFVPEEIINLIKKFI